MTREEARKNLIAIGISEPTEEQVSNYLNSIHSEVQKEKDSNKGLKEKADKADELQKELDKINEQNLSDLEKANNRIAELEKAQKISGLKVMVAEKFRITGEQANQVVKENGDIDYDIIGQIIVEKEKAAATAKEKEIANGSSNPGTDGGSGNGDKDREKPDDVKNIENISFAKADDSSIKAQDYYK